MKLTALFLILSIPCIATTIHVPADQPTIQVGIDASSVGDTVLVACGTYYESEIDIHPSIVLMSETGEAECVVIDAQNSPGSQIMRCYNLDSTTEIVGFTFTRALGANGQSSAAGLACASTSASIRNCNFIDNSAWLRGGGLSLTGLCSPTVENCWFTGNLAEEGGALYCDNQVVPTISNCIFDSNTAEYDGGAIRIENCGGLIDIRDCVFVGNTSGLGAGISLHQVGNPTIQGCTFYANSATTGSSIHAGSNSHPVVLRSILSFGLLGSGAIGTYGGTLLFECSDIFGNEGGDWVGEISDQLGVYGNISADPLFCDFDLDDFHLRNDSPCAPDNNDCGVLMGAWPVGCSTSAENATWGEIKALF